METLWLGLALGFGIGGSLGLLGGGGSILTVPALVYLVGQTPQVAVMTSLAIVGTNSVLGAFFHRSQGTLNWRVALLFGGAGMITAFIAAGFSSHLSPDLIMVAFASLMLVIGLLLIFRRPPPAITELEHLSLWKILASGASVGLLTGILGVGGGFLIVPALVMLVGLPMQQAVGTSLVVIAMNSLAGFAGHLGDAALDSTALAIFVTAGLAGTFAGARLAHRLPAARLRQLFAVFVIALAVFLLYDNLPRLF
jgi:uncharacterized protein